MNFIGADADFADAGIVLFGAPYDSTTSFRPGARFGSLAMRMESFGIETYSPYQDRDLVDVRVHDAGDLELPFGAPEPALAMVEGKAAEIFAAGKVKTGIPCFSGTAVSLLYNGDAIIFRCILLKYLI